MHSLWFKMKDCYLKGFIFTSGLLSLYPELVRVLFFFFFLSPNSDEGVWVQPHISAMQCASVPVKPAADLTLGTKSVFNHSQKQPSALSVCTQLKLRKQHECCLLTKNEECTLSLAVLPRSSEAGLNNLLTQNVTPASVHQPTRCSSK